MPSIIYGNLQIHECMGPAVLNGDCSSDLPTLNPYTNTNTAPGSEGASTQYLRTLVSNTIKGMVLGTRILKYWVLGPSGLVTWSRSYVVPSQTMSHCGFQSPLAPPCRSKYPNTMYLPKTITMIPDEFVYAYGWLSKLWSPFGSLNSLLGAALHKDPKGRP